ncbi:unnamed protein product [Arabis nemorensis]|uniref:Bifunctional inhibitor/plant lipid transfer protein/seed storage helical domain-containing protein n=1 Tax=Arabis nemorensis TaxID=586526 RepID=A0A565ALP3_9BRAS|nr:unnamed protein product [Arabis nemorensis]
MKFTTLACIAVVVIVVMSSLDPTKAVVARRSEEEEKVACNARELKPCVPAAEAGTKPSTECCGKLKEQESCLCGYIKNPSISQYFQSEGAHKVLVACGVHYPTC